MADSQEPDLSKGTSPLLYFSGEMKDQLREFIAFTRAGSFSIG